MGSQSNRSERVAQQIQAELSRLIEYKVKDPRLDTITVTAVKVTRDFSHAKVYFVTRDKEKREQSLMVLQKASGFLRHNLANELLLRTVPELHFHYDTSSEYGQHIDNLLNKLDLKD